MAAQRVCHTDSVINRYGMKELTNWVDMPLPERVGCLDMDERKVISDESVRMEILKHCGASNITEFMLHRSGGQVFDPVGNGITIMSNNVE